MKQYYVYIMASQQNGTLYIGSTYNLIKRVWEHKSSVVKSFTAKYKVNYLVYYEIYYDFHAAFEREKNLKFWKRAWKLKLIEQHNPQWHDLYQKILG